MEKSQIDWLNCAKFMAIFAVMTDHCNGLLYSNYNVAWASYYSVSLFVLISGMTSYISDSHHDDKWGHSYMRSIRKLLLAYCIATAVYYVWQTKAFYLLQYLTYLVHFNISGPHYFVLLYMQLMLTNRFLFIFLKKCKSDWKGYSAEFLVMVLICIFACWSTNYTNILDVYGGGGKLLGGTYLILFYFGMIIEKHGWLSNTSAIKNVLLSILFGIGYFCVWRFICKNGLALENYVPFGKGFNPPSLSFMSLAFCMLPLTFGVFCLLERSKYTKWITSFIAWLGKL